MLREQQGPADCARATPHAREPWAEAERVLCIPSRTLLDAASALMLGHALSRAGLAARVEPAGALSSARIVYLPADDVDIVVLCSTAGPSRWRRWSSDRRWPEAGTQLPGESLWHHSNACVRARSCGAMPADSGAHAF